MAFSQRKTAQGFRVVSLNLTPAQVAAREILLERSTRNVLLFAPNGGGHRAPGVDFVFSENRRIAWAGTELDGRLEAGETVSLIVDA
jgi:hypothetical protein